ncbi:MAG: dipeptide/oligopeptide/nickel ABC transporter ATP-binding protein [Treponema sp.]|jgi:ABC-type glutathione transport system ATPase component|nr:dipeptide/oligopeptide/nickel ABC transporter ATP-binding protein [Treponema sp.]
MSTSILTVRNVSNTYTSRRLGIFGKKEEKPVLDNVSLTINKGEIFGLAGESGSGKTTLGRCILGLIEYQGDILIDGLIRNNARPGFQEWALKLSAVFQDPGGALNPVKRVGWLLEEPLRIHRIGTKKERGTKVDEMLDLVGLDPSHKKRFPSELSSGQKQRVSIGCALMLRPSLVIADEPVSALDVSTGAQIINLFQDLKDSLGLSLLFISHNRHLVDYLCDHVAVMEKGKITEIG